MAFPLAGIGIGANLLGGLLGTRSERERLKKQRMELLAQLKPLESLLRARRMGLSATEGTLANRAVRGTLSGLASRGLIGSSISGPAVAEAVAPFELNRQRSIDDLMRQLVSSRSAIYGGTSLPGFGSAFGEAFGGAGDILSFVGGMKYAYPGGNNGQSG